MDKTSFEDYCNKIAIMKNEMADWFTSPPSVISDYLYGETDYGFGKVLFELLQDAYKLIAENLNQKKSIKEEDDIYEMAEALYYKKPLDSYRFNAYYFAVGVAAVALFNAPQELVDYSILDQNALIKFDVSVMVSEDSDPYRKNLKYYGIRLLDFSRNNQLVNFRPLKSSALELYSAEPREVLKKMMKKGGKVNIGSWRGLKPKMIYKCKICGRMESFDHVIGAKRAQPARPCPVCDAENTRGRCSMAPIKERLTILDGKYVCKCGQKVSLSALEENGYKCPSCGAEAQFKTAPVLDIKEFKKRMQEGYDKGDLVCGSNDHVSSETLRSIVSKEKNFERNFGLHTLYLAYGFLNWKDMNGTSYRSPLILCPITLTLDSFSGRYYFQADGDGESMFEVNKTLVQMLASYSSSCSITLPKQQEGFSYPNLVKAHLENLQGMVKEAVKSWEVEDTFGIGLFHYQKLQLHHDLEENAEKYLEHPIIRRLCGDAAARMQPGKKLARASMKYMILDADSSQEEVIKRAQEGESFILQGPPGSGKSQTITNIIAGALGMGKTVLFVTEKASARSVIVDNLHRCDAGEDRDLTHFVLDFSAFKRRGGAVSREPFVNELNLYLSPYSPTGGYDDHLLAQEQTAYDEIKSFMEKAHGEYNGKNFLRLLSDMAPYVKFRELGISFANIPLEVDKFTLLCNLMEDYYVAAGSCPGGIDCSAGALRNCCGDTGNTLYALATEYKKVCGIMDGVLGKLKGAGWRVICAEGTAEEYAELLNKWAEFPALSQRILLGLNEEKARSLLNYAMVRQFNLERIQAVDISRFSHIIHEKAMAEDVGAAIEQGKQFSSPFKRLGSKYKAWRDKILSCFLPAHSAGVKKYAEVMDTATLIGEYRSYRSASAEYESLKKEDMSTLGFIPASVKEWKELIASLNAVLAVLEENSGRALFDVKEDWLSKFETASHRRTVNELTSMAEELKKAAASEEDLRGRMSKYFSEGEDMYPYFKRSAEEVIANRGALPSVFHRHNAYVKLEKNGYLPILNDLIQMGITDAKEMKGVLCKTYYVNTIVQFLDENRLDELKGFTRARHEELLARYREIDGKVLASGARRIYDCLKSYLKDEAEREFGYETYPKIQSKSRYSIKRTISEQWDYIKKIRPCFMMSPLNVSQYIDIDIKFDLVIFDEASQIFTEDALASIVRGKQIIIAGDSKQLPPCDFFRAGDSPDEDDEELMEIDMGKEPSLLTTADKALNESSVSLAWHYRSSDESLIYYANKAMEYNLITFPGARHNDDDGVVYVSVPYDSSKCYDAGAGGTHINPAEVERITDIIYGEMIHPTRKQYSIGVVAFSNAQAAEIEEAWDEFKQDPSRRADIEEWEEAHKDEPLIFCNLDTVQGDERDTIIISVCYSEDDSGKFILPYLGRIRLESGKKRLNVAITRSKHRMIVVAMLNEITLKGAIASSSASEENKAGASMLQGFLEYARKNNGAKQYGNTHTSNNVAQSVCEVLDESNIAYDCDVGMSACKINIAVRTPSKPGDYCLGIIIDDPGRVDFDSVREYTRLTEQVLTGKYGWNIYRIYPAAWMNNYDYEKAALLRAIGDQLQ